MGVVGAATGSPLNLGDVGGVATLLVLVMVAVALSRRALLRDNLIARQSERVAMSSRLDMLTETNEMLGILNQVARTLPESMDMTEAVNATQRELASQFRATTIGLVVRDDVTSRWLPMIAAGCQFFESTADRGAPGANAAVACYRKCPPSLPPKHPKMTSCRPNSTSGMYTALRTRGKRDRVCWPSRTNVRTTTTIARSASSTALSSALALTIDNVRSFGRLRTIGADQERTRIARDLHDRLGQWLTYISMELERIIGEVPETTSLQSLYGDVQTAIDELRERHSASFGPRSAKTKHWLDGRQVDDTTIRRADWR